MSQVIEIVNTPEVLSQMDETQPLHFFQLIEKRSDTELLKNWLGQYRGLLDYDAMEILFEQKDARSILKCLWTETNAEARLGWLRDHSQMRHPLLYFELALEEILANPTMDTFLQVSMLYLQLGAFRLEQDFRCYDEISPSIQLDLLYLYNTHLDVIARKYIGAPYLVYLHKQETLMGQSNQARVAELAVLRCLDRYIVEVEKTKKLDSLLPNPLWLEGMYEEQVFIPLPQSCWMDKRKEVAQEYLQMLRTI